MLSRACLGMLNDDNSIRMINQTNVVLIPKNKAPELVMDYRSISLCNVVYKLVTKMVANRLKLVLPNLISQTQSTFVPGQLITDNVIVAFELLQSLQKKNSGGMGFMDLKLDMSKAYDCVEWCFIKKVPEEMRFPQNWIHLIYDCIFMSEFVFFILMVAYKRGLPPFWGFRQGCLLSPYLFLLWGEALSSLVSYTER